MRAWKHAAPRNAEDHSGEKKILPLRYEENPYRLGLCDESRLVKELGTPDNQRPNGTVPEPRPLVKQHDFESRSTTERSGA